MIKNILTLSFFSLSVCALMAQTETDIMRYSRTKFGGTARFNSMAGSMGALGGDMSTLNFNPAGIAVNKKSVIAFTPALYINSTASGYNGQSSYDTKSSFNTGNLGLIATFLTKDTATSWKSFHFGIAFNRLANYNNRVETVGDNYTSSFLDTYVASAQGKTWKQLDKFGEDLAYWTYIMDDVPAGSTNWSHRLTKYGQQQKRNIDAVGTYNETALSFGANYTEKILLGASIGFVTVKYNETVTYEEKDVKKLYNNFESFQLTQNLDTRGNGVNFKFGTIVKATDWLRIGAAIHTPTTIGLTDNYSNSMKSDTGKATFTHASPRGKYSYNITTPYRMIGSVGLILNKRGIINVEYEYVDYTSGRLSVTQGANVFSETNESVRKNYKAAGNLRIGSEVRFDPIALRAGYALYGSPYKDESENIGLSSYYTFGLGFREKSFFSDFAYVINMNNEKEVLYKHPKAMPVHNFNRSGLFMLTLGFRF